MTTTRDKKIKRLIYQSWHRGCKETDLILGKFSKLHLHEFSDNELALYEQFITENDWDIYAWLTHNSPLPEKYHHQIIEKIMNFKLTDTSCG